MENEFESGSGDEMRVLYLRRSGREVRALQFLTREGNAMKCEVCGAEVANSEEMQAHVEREHSLDERGDEELEAPDLMEDQSQRAPIVPGKNQ